MGLRSKYQKVRARRKQGTEMGQAGVMGRHCRGFSVVWLLFETLL